MNWYEQPTNGEYFSYPNSAANDTQPPQLFTQGSFRQPQESPQQYQPQVPQYLSKPMTPTEKGILRDIVNYKTQFANNEAAIKYYGDLLNLGNLDEKQTKEAQGMIDLLNFSNEELNKAANITRNTARALNIDTTGFNEDNTLDESQQNMYNIDARAIQDLMNLPSVREQQQKYYQEMRDMGARRSIAREAARQKHDEFRENNVNQILNGINDYGLNPDGSVNEFGMRLLGKLGNEDLTMTNVLLNGFANPKDAYGEANATYRQNLALNNQRQAQLANMQNDWAKLAAIQNFDWKKHKDTQEYNARMQELKSAMKGTGVSDDKLAQEISSVMRNTGLPQEVATEMVLRQHYSNSFKVPRDADGNIKTSDAEKVTNYTTGRLALLRHYLRNDDFAQAKEFINNYRNALASDDFKYAEQLDGDQITNILEILDLCEKVANGEISYEEMQNSRSHISAADLSRDNHDITANQNAKKIKENQAQKQARNNTESPKIWYSTDSTNPFIEKNPLDLKFKDTSR